MTGLFISIDEYIPDPEVEAVERALKYLEIGEEYEYVESVVNNDVVRRRLLQ
jgi:hypothetical protein